MKNTFSFAVGPTLKTVTCVLSALISLVSFNVRAGDGPRIPVVTATASANDGHVPANAIDGSLATRWSAEGDGQWLDLDLGLPATIGGVHIAWYKGNMRMSLFEVQTSNDGSSWATVFTGLSSGKSTNFEAYALSESTARYVRILCHGNSVDLWDSISEVQVFAPGTTPPPPPPVTNATPLAVQSVSASTNDPGDVPANTLDGSFSTRWSAEGDGQWIEYKLVASSSIEAANIAWYQGATRISLFDVQTSANGTSWQTVFTGASSGTSTNFETYQLTPSTCQYVRIVGHGNSQNLWNSITEARFFATNSGTGTSTNATVPVAGFTASPVQGVAPLAVQFTDQSSGHPSAWSWNFGDNTTSTVLNPSHTYSTAGSYTATLTVTGGGQSSSASHTITVTNATVIAAVTANFSASPSSGQAPLSVQFTDQSTGPVTSWNWSFGDGATSTAQSPSHVYSASGTYTATLTVKNSAGVSSSKSATIQANPQVTGGTLPSQVLNLSNWKLTLPTGSSGSPTEITQPSLASFVNPSYFAVNAAGNGVVFTAPCGGVTTSGSSYPRSELREMIGNGSATASWSTTSGISTMEVTEAITHLPVAKPQVIAGQIHDGVTKVIDCRLEGSKLYMEDASGGVIVVLTSSYQLGTTFTFKWVVQNGGIAIYYNGQYITTYSVNDSGCYFKVGDYTQSNTSTGDSATAYGQVVVYSATVSHQ